MTGKTKTPRIAISGTPWTDLGPLGETRIDSIETAFGVILDNTGMFDDPWNTMLGLALIDDYGIRKINLKHRGIDQPTDVLSFPMYEPGEIPLKINDGDPPRLLGDIVISVETVSKQAGEGGIGFIERFTECFIHGVLHLLGWGHENEDDCRKMEGVEDGMFRDVLKVFSE